MRSRLLGHYLLLMGLQRDLGHLRNQPADRETIRAHRQILVSKHIFQLHSVDHGEDPLQQGLDTWNPMKSWYCCDA